MPRSLILTLWTIGLVVVIAAIWNFSLKGGIVAAIGLAYALLLTVL